MFSKLKYYFFFHPLRKTVDRLKMDRFETETYKISVSAILLRTINVNVRRKNIHYTFTESDFIIFMNGEQLSSQILKFDNIFWEILKEVKKIKKLKKQKGADNETDVN